MRNRRVLGLYLATLLSFAILYGAYMTFIPLLLAERFGATPITIGPVMTVGSLATALAASRLGALTRRVPPDRLLPVAFLLFALSFLPIPWLPSYGWVAVAVAFFGVGQAFNYPVVLTLLAGVASEQHRGIFMSLNGMVIRIGQALGPVIMAGVYAVGGMNAVFLTAFGGSLLLAGGLPFFLGRGGATTRRSTP
jgi:predicted MFS family arabinose efflux permease